MTALLHSLFLVALAEMGDKTQILTLMLAARYSKVLPVVAGMFLATLANHGIAAFAGHWLTEAVTPEHLQIGVAVLFIGIGLWVLKPDSDDQGFTHRHGAFFTTLVTFFIAEIGDKTQLATVTLAADYPGAVWLVIMGTTLGVMVANVPAIIFGEAILARIKMDVVRKVAALCFIGVGVWKLAEIGMA